MRLRIQFEKTGPARFASHKDVQRIVQRALASAGVPVAWSEGFHPHMKLSFGPPLRTGWASRAEYIDVEVTAPPGPLAGRLGEALPEGLRVTGVALMPPRAPKLAVDIRAADYDVEIDDAPAPLARALEVHLRERVEREAAAPAGVAGAVPAGEAGEAAGGAGARAGRGRGASPGDGVGGGDAPRLLAARVEDRAGTLTITYTTTMHSGRTVAPPDVLRPVVDDPDALARPIRVTRRAQYVLRRGRFVSPISREAIRYAP